MESTTRRITGLTFGEALVIREAVRNVRAAVENKGGGDMGSTTSRYGVRLRLLEVALWASSVALAVMQAVVFAALWVIQVVGPRLVQLSEWTGGAVAETDLVMEKASTPGSCATSEPARPPARPPGDGPAPTVVDGTVIRVSFEDRERVS